MNFLITGANRGIGLHLTQFALENNHKVFALVRSPNSAGALNGERKLHGDRLEIIACDVTERSSIEGAHANVGDAPIDVLINNAGIFDDENFLEITNEKMMKVLSVNLLGPIHVAQVFLNNLKLSENPKHVAITSQMGSIADNSSGGHYSYRISKAALNMFMKSFSLDYPKIISLILHPGWVRTDMGGAQAPLLPRESARGLFKIITEAGPNQSGRFYNYAGKEIPW